MAIPRRTSGAVLKDLRIRAGMSAATVARDLGTTSGRLATIEAAGRAVPPKLADRYRQVVAWERVTLLRMRWVRLPGTDVEVLLGGAGRQEVVRNHRTARWGGWDLGPVQHRCYIRTATLPPASEAGRR